MRILICKNAQNHPAARVSAKCEERTTAARGHFIVRFCAVSVTPRCLRVPPLPASVTVFMPIEWVLKRAKKFLFHASDHGWVIRNTDSPLVYVG